MRATRFILRILLRILANWYRGGYVGDHVPRGGWAYGWDWWDCYYLISRYAWPIFIVLIWAGIIMFSESFPTFPEWVIWGSLLLTFALAGLAVVTINLQSWVENQDKQESRPVTVKPAEPMPGDVLCISPKTGETLIFRRVPEQ